MILPFSSLNLGTFVFIRVLSFYHNDTSVFVSELGYIRFPTRPRPFKAFPRTKTSSHLHPSMPTVRVTSASPKSDGPTESLADQLGCDCCSRGPWTSPVSPPVDIFDIPGADPIPMDGILDLNTPKGCPFTPDNTVDTFDVFDIPSPTTHLDLSNVLGQGFDTTISHVAHGLYIVPKFGIRLFGDWDELDEDVQDKLDVPSTIQLRYATCYPEREMDYHDQHGCLRETVDYNMGEYLITDGPASCSLQLYHPNDAYINMLAAYPMNAGHGTTFICKVKTLLRAAGIARLFLFVDNDADARVCRFYTDKCGFTLMDPLAAQNIPASITSIWYEDRLYQAVL